MKSLDAVLERAAGEAAFADCLLDGRSVVASQAGFALSPAEVNALDTMSRRVLRRAIFIRRFPANRFLRAASGLLLAGAMAMSGCDLSGVIQDAARAPTDTTDTDMDGLPDWWETLFSLDPNDDGSLDPNMGTNGDPDGDGRINYQEYLEKTDPHDSALTDSDGDLMPDAFELYHQTPTDPALPHGLDMNDDGSTNPIQDPDADLDGDEISNYEEYLAGSDPTSDHIPPIVGPPGCGASPVLMGPENNNALAGAALVLALAALRRRWRMTATEAKCT